jgi:hypothetical protein
MSLSQMRIDTRLLNSNELLGVLKDQIFHPKDKKIIYTSFLRRNRGRVTRGWLFL